MAPKYNRKKSVQYTHKSNSGSKKQLYLIIGVLAIVVSIIAITYFAGGFGSNNPSSPIPTPTVVPIQTPATNDTKVLLQTNMGNVTIQLFDNKPITTKNFLNLVEAGKYDGTVFHRIMKDFMIQGGVINEDLQTINDEIGSYNHNYKYTIAMAKTFNPNSATSSFFINTVDNNSADFDNTYTAFGIVIEGKDVVDAIARVPVTVNPSMGNELSKPTQTVTLISATIIS
ncbi:MAG: peptidylprolyl isomerase [Nitrososphaerota archaeon]|jgi:peptidyl-prolyl cis-trans isomerase A (cyclophilin A)|nr:peptidylprolyl isomerase [Nitrososphaerota archaeon]